MAAVRTHRSSNSVALSFAAVQLKGLSIFAVHLKGLSMLGALNLGHNTESQEKQKFKISLELCITNVIFKSKYIFKIKKEIKHKC